ncbi:MAG TPA: homoserine dehydrogenase [Candidatus Baltobacteraceae bacterium]|nr:homoserine dehydrogenase [Candidatus Baltobacteraceae bacterium]
MECTVGIGLLGCGTVGSSVAARLISERASIERRSGVRYELRAVAIRNSEKPRHGLDPALFTRDARALVEDPRVDLIVELIGGTNDAADLLERALDRGRSVVTANKDLIATQGPRLHALAASRGCSLRYEAAVCGAIPIVRTIDAALAGDRVEALGGVVNGTCTAILSAMEAGAEYVDALAQAQRLGYAEADPTNDVEGIDAAHKLAVLVQLAFGLAVISPRIRHSGIAQVSKRDIARAQMLGYRIRLVAAAARSDRGAFADVAPVLVPAAHPFAQASGPENAVRVVARDAGPLNLSGRGAGGPATASAVLGDIVASLRAIGDRHGRHEARAFEPALEVAPFFDELARHPELPRYPRWDDTLLDAPVSRQNSAFS